MSEEALNFKQDPVHHKFDIGDEIGSGQFAVVKKCSEKSSGLEFAAKFMKKRRSKALRRGVTLEQIIREATVLRSVAHQGIIYLHDIYETKMEFVLILELLSGGELFEFLSEQDFLTEDEAVGFLIQVIRAIEYLHDLSIVHLDIKPENIVLKNRTRPLHLKLIDFGLARKISKGEPVREMMGTPEFVAPEIIDFEVVGFPTDMWSIGVLTYIMLSGASPFLGDDNNETFSNISHVDYEFDDEYFKEISQPAKDFIEGLLIKKPSDRMTAKECLAHEWLEEEVSAEVTTREATPSTTKLKRRSTMIKTDAFKAFTARARWKKSFNKVIAVSRIAMLGRKNGPLAKELMLQNTESDSDTDSIPSPPPDVPKQSSPPLDAEMLRSVPDESPTNLKSPAMDKAHIEGQPGKEQAEGIDLEPTPRSNEGEMIEARRDDLADKERLPSHSELSPKSERANNEVVSTDKDGRGAPVSPSSLGLYRSSESADEDKVGLLTRKRNESMKRLKEKAKVDLDLITEDIEIEESDVEPGDEPNRLDLSSAIVRENKKLTSTRSSLNNEVKSQKNSVDLSLLRNDTSTPGLSSAGSKQKGTKRDERVLKELENEGIKPMPLLTETPSFVTLTQEKSWEKISEPGFEVTWDKTRTKQDDYNKTPSPENDPSQDNIKVLVTRRPRRPSDSLTNEEININATSTTVSRTISRKFSDSLTDDDKKVKDVSPTAPRRRSRKLSDSSIEENTAVETFPIGPRSVSGPQEKKEDVFTLIDELVPVMVTLREKADEAHVKEEKVKRRFSIEDDEDVFDRRADNTLPRRRSFRKTRHHSKPEDNLPEVKSEEDRTGQEWEGHVCDKEPEGKRDNQGYKMKLRDDAVWIKKPEETRRKRVGSAGSTDSDLGFPKPSSTTWSKPDVNKTKSALNYDSPSDKRWIKNGRVKSPLGGDSLKTNEMPERSAGVVTPLVGAGKSGLKLFLDRSSPLRSSDRSADRTSRFNRVLQEPRKGDVSDKDGGIGVRLRKDSDNNISLDFYEADLEEKLENPQNWTRDSSNKNRKLSLKSSGSIDLTEDEKELREVDLTNRRASFEDSKAWDRTDAEKENRKEDSSQLLESEMDAETIRPQRQISKGVDKWYKGGLGLGRFRKSQRSRSEHFEAEAEAKDDEKQRKISAPVVSVNTSVNLKISQGHTRVDDSGSRAQGAGLADKPRMSRADIVCRGRRSKSAERLRGMRLDESNAEENRKKKISPEIDSKLKTRLKSTFANARNKFS